jgi:hypothetical protein
LALGRRGAKEVSDRVNSGKNRVAHDEDQEESEDHNIAILEELEEMKV